MLLHWAVIFFFLFLTKNNLCHSVRFCEKSHRITFKFFSTYSILFTCFFEPVCIINRLRFFLNINANMQYIIFVTIISVERKLFLWEKKRSLTYFTVWHQLLSVDENVESVKQMCFKIEFSPFPQITEIWLFRCNLIVCW